MDFSAESVQKLLDSSDFGERIRGLNQLRSLPTALAFEMIQPLLKDPNARVRYAATSQLDTLGLQDRAKAGELLTHILRSDPEVDVKAAAADAIGALKLTDALEELERTYHQTTEWLLQMSIIATLGEMGDRRSLPLLRQGLDSDNELVQTAAIGALGELGDSEAVAWIVPFATHEDWQIRYRLAQALGHLGGTEAGAVLQQLAQDGVEQVAKEAREQL